MADMVTEAIEALGNAAAEERSVRFGHEVAGSLHAYLVAAREAEAAAAAAPEPEHVHAWQVLGWHRPQSETLVVQACTCGTARDFVAARMEATP
jgi:hypothetical protein